MSKTETAKKVIAIAIALLTLIGKVRDIIPDSDKKEN